MDSIHPASRSCNRRCMDNPRSPSVRCWALTGGWDYAKPYLGSLRWDLKGHTHTWPVLVGQSIHMHIHESQYIIYIDIICFYRVSIYVYIYNA